LTVRAFLADERAEAHKGTMILFTVIIVGAFVLFLRCAREEALRTMPTGSSG